MFQNGLSSVRTRGKQQVKWTMFTFIISLCWSNITWRIALLLPEPGQREKESQWGRGHFIGQHCTFQGILLAGEWQEILHTKKDKLCLVPRYTWSVFPTSPNFPPLVWNIWYILRHEPVSCLSYFTEIYVNKCDLIKLQVQVTRSVICNQINNIKISHSLICDYGCLI